MVVEQTQKVLTGFSAKRHGYWTAEKGKNMRLFLEEFARQRNFDPLVAESWYAISKEDLSQYKVEGQRR
jgi:hypothetical protein